MRQRRRGAAGGHRRALDREYGCEILDGIGSTEMLHIFLSNRPGQVRYGTTGQPVPGYELRIVGDDGRDCGPGEIGELQINGPSAAIMYWNNRAKTKATFAGEWTRSGDKYTRDADGYYTYGGRSDDMLKVGGIYVSPFEVEACLMTHASVLEAAVIGATDHDGLIKPKAFVVLKPGQQASAEELQGHVKAGSLPTSTRAGSHFVPELPKTATGRSSASSCARQRLRKAMWRGRAACAKIRAATNHNEGASNDHPPPRSLPRTALVGAASTDLLLPQIARAQSGKVRVGFALPPTPAPSQLGVAIENGVRMAIGEKGGKLGGREIEWFKVDDESEPSKGVENANRLVQRDKVDVLIGTVHSGVQMGIQRVARESGVLSLIPNAGVHAATRCAHQRVPHLLHQQPAHAGAGQAHDGQGPEAHGVDHLEVRGGRRSLRGLQGKLHQGRRHHRQGTGLPFPNVEFQALLTEIASLRPMPWPASSPAAARPSSSATTRPRA